MTALNPTFAKLGVRDEIVRALAEDGIEHAFAIQELTLPLALAGDDLIGQARTGMGKTFAFGVPLLQEITNDPDRPLAGIPRALVVVPTRELCLQVSNDLADAAKYLTAGDRKLSVVSIFGGRAYEPQIDALRSTSASCPTSNESCGRSPRRGSRCCSRRRCRTRSSRWPAPS